MNGFPASGSRGHASAAGACALMLMVLLVAPGVPLAQTPSGPTQGAGVVTTLVGKATVARASIPQPIPLQFKDRVFVADVLRTAKQSVARLLLGGRAVVTVRELSELTVTEEAGRSLMDITEGRLGVALARERMRPGESLMIRTPNAIAAVRGTILIVEVIRTTSLFGQSQVTTTVSVLDGSVEVSTRAAPAKTVTVSGSQSVSVEQNKLGGVTFLSNTADLFEVLKVPSPHIDVPQPAKQLIIDSQQQQGATLGELLAPSPSGPLSTSIQPQSQSQSQVVSTTQSTGGPPITAQPTDQPDVAINQTTVTPASAFTYTVQNNQITLDPGQNVINYGGTTTRTGSSPVVLIDQSTITQAGPDNFIQVAPGASTTLAGPLLTVTGSTLGVGANLLAVQGSLSSSTTTPLIGLDPTTVTAQAGDLVRIAGGTLTLAGPLLTDTNGTLTVGGALIRATGGGTLTMGTSAPALQLTGTTATGSNLLAVDATSQAAFAGGLLKATGATLSFNQALLDVQGSVSSTSPGALVNLDPTAARAGGLVRIGSAGRLTLAGSLLSQAGGTLSVTGNAVDVANGGLLSSTAGAPLLQFSGAAANVTGGSLLTVTGGTVTAAPHLPLLALGSGASLRVSGSLVDLANTTLNLSGQPLAQLGGGSTLVVNGPLVHLSGGTVTASALVQTDQAGNRVMLTGPLLSLSNGAALQVTGGFLQTGGSDSVTFAPGSGQPVIQLTDTSLAGGGSGTALVQFGTGSGPPLIQGGVALIATSSGAARTLSLTGPLLELSGVTLTDPNAQIQLTNMTVTQTGTDGLIKVSGLPVTIAGPLLQAVGTSLAIPTSLIDVHTSFTSNGTSPLATLSGSSSLTSTGGSLLTLSGSGNAVVLSGPLLSLPGGTPTVTLAGDGLTLLGGSVTGPTNGSALIDIAATGTNGFTAAGSLVNAGVGTTLNLGGPVLSTAGTSTVAVGGSLLAVNGATVTRAGSAPLVTMTGGSLSTGGALVSAAGSTLTLGSGAPLFSAAGGSTLTLNGHVLDLTNTSLNLGNQAIGSLTADSTLTLHGSFVRMSSGAVSVDRFIAGDGTGNLVVNSASPVVDLTNATLATTGSSISSGTTQPSVTLGAGVPEVRLNNSTFTIAGGNLDLDLGVGRTFGTSSGAVALIMTNGSTLTQNEGGLVNVQGGGAAATTATVPLVQLNNSTLTLNPCGGCVTDFQLARIRDSGTVATINGPFVDSSGSTITMTGDSDLLKVGGGAALQTGGTTAGSLFQFTGGAVTVGGSLVVLEGGTPGGTVNVTSPNLSLFTATNTALTYANTPSASTNQAFVFESGTTLVSAGSAPLISINGGSVHPGGGGGGDFMLIGGDGGAGSVTLAGPLLALSNLAAGTFTVDSNVLVRLMNNSTLSHHGILTLSNSSLSLNGPLVRLEGSSTLTAVSGPVFTIADSTLTLNSGVLPGVLISPDGTGNHITRNGEFLDLSNSTVAFVTANTLSGTDTLSVSLKPNEANYRLTDSNLTLTGSNAGLGGYGFNVASPTIDGVHLIAVDTTGQADHAISLGGSLLNATTGATLTNSAAQIQLTNYNVTQTASAAVPLIALSGGLYTMSGPLVSMSGGTLTLQGTGAGAVVSASSGITSSTASPFLSWSNATVSTPLSVGTALFQMTGSGASSFAGPLLVASGSAFQLGGAAFLNSGTTVTDSSTAPFLDVTGGSLSLGLRAVYVPTGSVTLAGPLLSIDGTTLTPSQTVPLTSVGTASTAASLTIGGPLLNLSNTTLDLTQGAAPQTLLSQAGGSTVTTTAGPFVKLTNATLIADSVITTDGAGNHFTSAGSLLNLNNSTLTLRVFTNRPAGATDVFQHTFAADEPVAQLTNNSHLTVTQGNPTGSLACVGCTGGQNPFPGLALTASDSTISITEGILSFEGGTPASSTSSQPLIQLTNSTLTVTGGGASVIAVQLGGAGTVAGPLLSATNSAITVPNDGNLLLLNGQVSLTANNAGLPGTALLQFSGGSVSTGAEMIAVTVTPTPPAGTLTLHRPLFSASGTAITYNTDASHPGAAFLAVTDSGALTNDAPTPLIALTNGSLAAGAGGGSVLNITAAGTVSLQGGLLAAAGTAIQSGTAPLLAVSGQGSLTAAGAASNLVDLSGGATLNLGGPVLTTSGGSTVTAGGSVLSVNGATVTRAGTSPLMSLNGGSLSAGGALLSATGSTLALGTASPLVAASGGATVTVNGASLALANTNLNLGSQPVMTLAGGSTLMSTPTTAAFQMSGGTLAADTLLSMSGSTPNHLVRTGPLLALADATVSLRSITDFTPASDTISVTLAQGQANVRLTDSSMTMTDTNDALSTLGGLNVSPLTHAGVALIATGTTQPADHIISIAAPLVRFTNGVTLTEPAPQIQLTNVTVSQTGTSALVDIVGPAPISMAGGLLQVSGSILTPTSGVAPVTLNAGSALSVGGPLFDLTNTNLALTFGAGPAQPLVRMAADTTLTLGGSFLRMNGGTLTADSYVAGDATNIVGFTSTSPFVDLTNATVTMTGQRLFGTVSDTGAFTLPAGVPVMKLDGSTLVGGGPDLCLGSGCSFGSSTGALALVMTNGSTLTMNKEVVDLVDYTGTTATTTATAPLIQIANSTLTITGSLPYAMVHVDGGTVGQANGPLLAASGSTITLTGGISLLLVESGGSLTRTGGGAGATFQFTGGAMNVAAETVLVRPNATLTVNSPLLSAAGTTFNLSTALANDAFVVSAQGGAGGTLTGTTTSPLLSLNGGGLTVNGTRDFFRIGGNPGDGVAAMTLAGGVLTLQNIAAGHFTVGSGTLLHVSGGSSLSVAGPFLDASGSILSFTGPLLTISDGSTVTNTVGPAVTVSGGSLTADTLITTTGTTPSTINLTGTVLNVGNAVVQLRLLVDEQAPPSLFTLLRGTNVPLIQVTGGSLTITQDNPDGIDLNGVQGGVLLNVTGGTVTTPSPLATLEAVTFTDTNPLLQLTAGAVLNITGAHHLFQARFAGPIGIAGPLFSLNGASTINVANGVLLRVDSGASLTLSNNGQLGQFLDAASRLNLTHGVACAGDCVSLPNTPFQIKVSNGANATVNPTFVPFSGYNGSQIVVNGSTANGVIVWVDGAGSFLQLGTAPTLLILPPDQTINTNQAFASAQHGVGGAGGTLAGTGIVTVQGLYQWESGTMTGTGTTLAQGGMTLSSSSTKALTGGRTLTLSGSSTWTGNGQVLIGSPSTTTTLVNTGLFQDQNTGSASITNDGGTPSITNTGTYQKTGGGTTTVGVPFTNTAPGGVDVQAGTLRFTGGGTSTGGTFTVAAPATLEFGTGPSNLNAGSLLSGPGTVLISGGPTNFNTGGIDRLTGTLQVSGGTLAASGALVGLNSGDLLNPSGTMVSISSGNLTTTGGADLITVNNGGTLSAGGSLFTASGGTTDGAGNLLTVAAGGTTVSNSSLSPVVSVIGGIVKFAANFFGLAGSNTAVDQNTGLDLGTDRPLRGPGAACPCPVTTPLVDVSGSGTVSAGGLVKIDTALLEASAPLLSLSGNSTLTATTGPLVDLSFKANVTSLGPLVVMTGSTLNVNAGPLINLAGGSLLTVSGDLLQLNSGSTINLNSLGNGFLINASAGSVLNVSGGLVNFGGTGNNLIAVKNNVAPTTTLSVGGVNIPVHLANGATIGQVSILGTPVKNTGLGSITFPNSGSLINVDGTTAKVTIKGQ